MVTAPGGSTASSPAATAAATAAITASESCAGVTAGGYRSARLDPRALTESSAVDLGGACFGEFLDRPDQDGGIERLGDVSVDAGFETAANVGLLRPGRDHHDLDTGRRGVGAQSRRRGQPIENGQRAVEDDHVRRVLRDRVEAGLAVFGEGHVEAL